jgi:hypothetical protein
MHQAQGVKGALDFRTGEVSVLGGYAGFLVEETVRFHFEADGRLGETAGDTDAAPRLSSFLKNANMVGHVADVSMGGRSAAYWPFSLRFWTMSFLTGGESSEVNVRTWTTAASCARGSTLPAFALVVGKWRTGKSPWSLDIKMEMQVLWP